jgi:type VI secretion system protein ImpL
VNCSSGNEILENYNYPVRKTFVWSPQDCGDVSLEIHVGDLVLKKTYSGYNGLVKFLKDFRTGRKTFSRSDFPAQRGKLVGYGISKLTVMYEFGGQNTVLRLALKDPARVPETITIQQDMPQYAGN